MEGEGFDVFGVVGVAFEWCSGAGVVYGVIVGGYGVWISVDGGYPEIGGCIVVDGGCD